MTGRAGQRLFFTRDPAAQTCAIFFPFSRLVPQTPSPCPQFSRTLEAETTQMEQQRRHGRASHGELPSPISPQPHRSCSLMKCNIQYCRNSERFFPFVSSTGSGDPNNLRGKIHHILHQYGKQHPRHKLQTCVALTLHNKSNCAMIHVRETRLHVSEQPGTSELQTSIFAHLTIMSHHSLKVHNSVDY